MDGSQRLSDSEEEIITSKKKAFKLFNDDDKSDDDKKSEKSSEFVGDIDPLHGTETQKLSKNSTQGKCNNRSSSNSDEERSRDSLLNKSRARSNSKSDDERSKASSRKSRSRSRSSSSSSNERSKASSRKSRSRSRSRSSSSSERSKAGSQKSRSRSRSSSSSSNKRSKASSRKSRSRSRNRSSSSSERSKASSQKFSSRKSRSRSRSSLSSSSERSKASSKKSRSRSRSSSSSDDNRSKASSRKSRSRSSSSNGDNRSKVNTRKSRSRSTSKSDDQSKASSKKSRVKSNSSSDDERLKETLRNQLLNAENTTLTETVNQSNKSDDSDNETLSINKRTSRIIDSESDSDIISKSKQPTPSNDTPTVQKSSGKFSLITASDLESEDDRPPTNRSSSENESISKTKKKSKKLQKKKSSKKSSVLKSNGLPESMNSESENEEGNSSPKHPRKSIPKPKKAKKEKDPLMSIRSETQRMIREGRISLPYHQPKQHTLLEFLQRRKAAPSMPLRASADEMKNVCERLTIKEKEVEEFFKSESEPSDVETENTTQAPALNQDTAMDVETSADFCLETAPKASESVETIIAPETTENQNTAINLEPSVDCTLENIPKATESIEIDSLPNNDSSENASSQHESMDTSTLPENSTQLIDTDTNSVQEETSSSNPLKNNEGTCNEKASPDESKPTENIIATSNEKSIDVLPETIESSSTLSESNACYSKSDEPTVTENIPDSVDFELQIQDSCNDTEAPPNKSAPLDIQPDNSTGSKPSTEDDFPPIVSAPKKNSAKSRLERTLALLSSHNIDLQPVNLSDFSEEMQFEIPQYNEHSMAKGKLKKNNSEIDVLGTQKSYGGVWELKEKFIKHSMTKNKPTKSSSQINVVSTQKDAEGEITGVTKETLVLTLDDPESEFSDPKFSKPGAKHAYLKEKMLKTLISKKEAYWNEYQTEKQKIYGSDSEEEKNDDDETCSTKKLDFEPYHPEDELDDEELIEDDIIIKEKDRKKNYFLDEEAEVSDPEELDENADEFGQDDEVDENADESIHEDEEENEENDLLHDEDTKESDDDVAQSTSVRSDDKESNDDSINRSLFKYNTTGTELENKVLGLESMSQIDESEDFTDSQIFGICSGKFTSQISPSKPNTESDFFADSQNVEDSQNICLSLPEPKEHTQNMINNRDQLFESDGSDNEELFARKKRAMRIEDSDDESEIPAPIGDDKDDENFEAEDQEEDFENDEAVEDDDDDNVADIEAEEYGYNSDEELVPVKSKVAEEFFENEAELSESEWGSEDENERDLDKFEKEEGDDDELDNDKLKEELGKIHMRQLLDDDQHDVRMLKEMLLEDGELHSDAKRQRKFQWKNLDGDDFFLKNNNDSDDENALRDDDETEEHWRKIRHERETFLSQQEEKPCLNELENVESTFIQLPGKTKIVNESITRVQQDVANSASGMTNKTSPRPNSGLDSKFKCGSFLSRGKFLLSKIALSVSDTKERVGGAKNGRNFVFGTISPEKKSASVAIEKTEKRKISNDSVSISKRVKFSLENGPNGSKRESLLAQLALSD